LLAAHELFPSKVALQREPGGVNFATARQAMTLIREDVEIMPNGGSDCCGTCWFNIRNKGEAGYDHANDPEPPFCTIRSLPIEDPFYTYCGNHPRRRPERDPIPIGPVFAGNSDGVRTFWQASPDTEQIRQHLLDLLSEMQQPVTEYPIGMYLDELVVLQLGEFREARAVDGLRRLGDFDPASTESGPFGRTRATLVTAAREALEKIAGSGGDLHASRSDEMKEPVKESFPKEVVDALKTYVYRLIDPRNGETFYVGKGKGNRVFSHIRAEPKLEGDLLDNKMKRIHEIRLAGFEVAHVIHRHGMDEKTAMEVEAALIDAYPGLTNKAAGSGYGAMHAKEIITRYCAPPAVFNHKALLINVSRTASEIPLYEATRYAWKVDRRKAERAEVILSTLEGLIVGAFVADKWLPATSANFPGREDVPGRFGFVGREASADLKHRYVGKRAPDKFRKPGAANPVKYTW
jgi:uncharacterized protein